MPVLPRALSPSAWVTVEKLTQQVLWLVLFAILAPILGPRAYGVFSIVMVFVGFCEFVLGEGAVEALVMITHLDQHHAAAANVVSVVLALVVGAVLAGAAPLVAASFGDPEIGRLMWALTPLPVLSLLSAAPIASLRRALLYKRLAIRSIAGLAIGGAVGIALALAGAGVWALAFQVLTQRAAEVAIAWFSVPLRFGFRWSRPHIRELQAIGLHMFAARVMIFGGSQLPRLALGYTLGPAAVGIFTLANRFLDVIVFTAVFPRVSVGRIELRGPAPGSPGFERIFADMVQNVSLLAFPLLLGAATLMPELFALWLDPRWAAGVVPAQLILLSGLPLVLVYCFDAALLAARLPAVFKWLSTAQAVTTLVTVLGAAGFGLNAVCASLAVRPWLVLPLYLVVLGRSCGMSILRILALPLRPLLGAVAMAVVLNLPFPDLPPLDPKLHAALLVGAGAAIYVLFAYVFARRQLRAVLAGILVPRAPSVTPGRGSATDAVQTSAPGTRPGAVGLIGAETPAPPSGR